MQLEKEIKQTQFISQHQKLMLNIMLANNKITYWLKGIFERHGLTLQQYNILRILRGAKSDISTAQLKERMLDKNSDTSRIVERLILKNLVKKVPNNSDKRLVSITITEQALDILSKIDDVEETFFIPLQTLSDEDCIIANELLNKITTN